MKKTIFRISSQFVRKKVLLLRVSIVKNGTICFFGQDCGRPRRREECAPFPDDIRPAFGANPRFQIAYH